MKTRMQRHCNSNNPKTKLSYSTCCSTTAAGIRFCYSEGNFNTTNCAKIMNKNIAVVDVYMLGFMLQIPTHFSTAKPATKLIKREP